MKNKLFLIFVCLILLSVSSVSASDINQTNIDDVDNSVLSTSNDVIVDTISVSENDNLTSNDEYVDVNEAYDSLNAFRTEDNVWQWNEDDTTKTYFNTNNDNKLGHLAWDTALEETAKIRAKELSQSFSHTRPDGNNCFTIFPDNLLAMGENIAMGTSLTGNGATEIWKETDYMYDGQGHRRNMLSSDFNCVGIAGFEKDGNIYWVQDFGYNSNIVYDENVRPTPIETPETNNGLYVNSSVKTNGDGSKTNPFKYLKSALDKAEDGNTIYIAPGTYTGVNNVGLTIDKSLNITNWTKGEVIFDGEKKSRIFEIVSVTDINGLTLINGNILSSNGGAIYSNGNVTVSNCTFVNNTATDNVNNGSIYSIYYGNGGAIYSNDDVTVSNCTFVNNSATTYGGAIYSNDDVTVSNCTFVNNSANRVGGAIYGFTSSVINSCTFINNNASGSAIYTESGFISNSTFVNNYGGAISIISGSVVNCSFVGNSAKNTSYGGAISAYGSTSSSSVVNCTFVNNSAYGAGAIFISGSVVNCSFVGNSANDGDGGAIVGDGSVINCTFVNNSANRINIISGGFGGAISPFIYDFIIVNCTFVNNSAFSGAGAISTSSSGSVVNCTFVNNYAFFDGGAIGGDGSVINCTFVNNTADSYGGAIVGDGSVINCTFVNNSARNCGAICTSNGSISNSTFENNMEYSIFISSNRFDNNVSLNNNLLNNGLIYNGGIIVSPTSIVVLNNKTINTSKKDFILNATIYDDNGNIIVCDDFNFTVNNKSIKGILENDTFTAHVNLDGSKNIINATVNDATSVRGLLTNNSVKIGIINLDTNTQISAPDVIKYFHGSERFIVTITNNNLPVANGTVKITINGVTYTRTTNASGKASIPLGLASGTYQVTTEYGNQKVNSKVTIKPTITANDVSKIFRNGTQYYATFTDSQGNLLKNTDVTFNINGVFYTRKTNENGTAKLNINLNPGKYILTANNPVTDEQKSNNIEVLPSIIENNDITKYYRNGTQYVVKILNIDGTIAGAGINVTFNINGVFYTRITNASGYAKLNINLAPDEYTITAEYNGLKVSNKIKVLPVLSAEDLSMSFRDGSKFEAKLLDGQGNAYASQTIKFNINGVFYDRTTDANGIAKLNINLMSGKYIITSMYNGAAIANEITIS